MIAARTLAGFTQAQLDLAFKKDRLSKITGKLERGEYELGDSYIDSMVRHLKVPREWFTEDDWRSMIRLPGRASPAEVLATGLAMSRSERRLLAQALLERLGEDEDDPGA